jgi:hypothetical protein
LIENITQRNVILLLRRERRSPGLLGLAGHNQRHDLVVANSSIRQAARGKLTEPGTKPRIGLHELEQALRELVVLPRSRLEIAAERIDERTIRRCQHREHRDTLLAEVAFEAVECLRDRVAVLELRHAAVSGRDGGGEEGDDQAEAAKKFSARAQVGEPIHACVVFAEFVEALG